MDIECISGISIVRGGWRGEGEEREKKMLTDSNESKSLLPYRSEDFGKSNKHTHKK